MTGKLSKHDVQLIRGLYRDYLKDRARLDEYSPSGIARKFGVAQSTIVRIVNYSTYKARDAD